MRPQDPGKLQAVRRLLASVGPCARPIRADVPCAEYDWRAPRAFIAQELEKLAAAVAALGAAISAALKPLLHQDVELRADPIAQRYGGQLGRELAAGAELFAAVSAGEEPCGLVALDAATARAWVVRLLGGTESGTDRPLSELELELLGDVVGAVAAGASGVLQAAGGPVLRAAGGVADRAPVLPGSEATVYVVVALRAEADAPRPVIRLAVTSETFAAVVGRGQARTTPQQARAYALEHFAHVPVEAEVFVGAARLRMGDAASLEAGDVILLPRRLDEPMELRVKGSTLLWGLPVVCGGRYALEVVRTSTGGR